MLKKAGSLMLTLAVLLFSLQIGVLCVFADANFSAGDGSAQNPYQISNAQELKNLANLVNSGNTTYNANNVHYKVTQDIDLNPGYTFKYDDNTKRVEVSKDGNVICYLGTGEDTGKYFVDATSDSLAGDGGGYPLMAIQ